MDFREVKGLTGSVDTKSEADLRSPRSAFVGCGRAASVERQPPSSARRPLPARGGFSAAATPLRARKRPGDGASNSRAIERARLHELSVAAVGHHLSARDDDDPGDELEQAFRHRVRDEKRRPPFQRRSSKGRVNQGFALGVDGRGRAHPGSGLTGSARLPGRARSAAAGPPTVLFPSPRRECRSRWRTARRSAGRGAISAAFSICSPRGVRGSVADVLEDRVVEKDRVLGDESDPGAEVARPDVADRRVVDPDVPRLRVVEPQQEIQERRLAAAVGADDRHDFVRLDLQREPVQDALATDDSLLRVVAERDVLKGDRLELARERDRLGRFGNAGLVVDDVRRSGRSRRWPVSRGKTTSTSSGTGRAFPPATQQRVASMAGVHHLGRA